MGYGKYLLIWVWLIALLVAGTFISSLHISKTIAIGLILLISLIKTGLVALFYMHLKSERFMPIWVVVVFPFILVGVAALLVLLGLAFA